MRKSIIIIVLFLVLFGMSVVTSQAQAQEAESCEVYCIALSSDSDTTIQSPPGQTCICNPLGSANFTDILDRILGFIFNIAIVLSPIMILIAGVMFITAGGDPARISKGKQILIWTVVGFIVILLSRGLIAVIRGIIGI